MRQDETNLPETACISPVPGTGIVVPPGCDNAMLRQSGEPVHTYIPPSWKESPPPELFRAPAPGERRSPKSMTDYLREYLGTHICLDLWEGPRWKIKRSGVLTEVGRDFLALRNPGTGVTAVIDLTPVRYVNIYVPFTSMEDCGILKKKKRR